MRIRLFLVLVLALTMAIGAATSAFAMEHECTGRAYGEHVAHHAMMGHFGPDMSPGMHRGFAGFCEHHEH